MGHSAILDLLAAGYALRLHFAPLIGATAGYLFFLPAIVFAAVIGGAVIGITITAFASALGLQIAIDHGFTQTAIGAITFAVNGTIISVIGELAIRSYRQLRDSNHELRAREAHLKSIVETIPDAMIMIDDRGIVHSFSAAAETLFQWHPDEIIGHNVSKLMPQPYRDAHDSYIARYLATGEAKIIGKGRITVGLRKDGSTFPIGLSVGEMRSDKRFFIGFVRDWTERQQTEARLHELQSELIYISRLSAMGEMASALAHELNQPLSAIANYQQGIQNIVAQNNDATALALREPATAAVEQALRAGEIIRRIRGFVSRGDQEREVFPLNRLIEEASALALIGAKAGRMEVQFDLTLMGITVFVDRIQVQQVLLNLIRNAMEAMEGADTRRLRISSSVTEADMALVEVSDTGPGISAEISGCLFQPFVTTKSEGMGVGLSICRTIIEAQGGRIWAESPPEGGAAFCFTLPIATGK